jgi:hypothetical protein
LTNVISITFCGIFVSVKLTCPQTMHPNYWRISRCE